MKIAMMTPWNVACGVSIHAELVGREWVKAGHELKVFAPQEEDKLPTARDEPFVSRCYSMLRSPKLTLKDLWLDPKPFLEFDYDFFVVQNLELLPIYELIKMFPEIKRKAKTILVIHEGNKSCFSEQHLAFDWHAIVCFDKRYEKEFSKVFSAEKFHIIPYPAHPMMLGDKRAARQELKISQDQKAIFSYGIWFQNRLPVLPALQELSKEIPFKYLTIIHEVPPEGLKAISEAKSRYSFFEVREEALPLEKLYTYLHASDAHLLWKFSEGPNLLVCSSAYLTLGSGCPIVINASGYARDLGEEVFKFNDLDDLQKILARILDGEKPHPKAVDDFMSRNEASKVASSFIELFSCLG